jgi:hypothetical protein
MSVKGEMILVNFAWLLTSRDLDNSGQVDSTRSNLNYYYLSGVFMKFVLLLIVLSFTFIGCDNKDQPNLESNNNFACGEGKTMVFGKSLNTMDWKITFKTVSFPTSISLFINETLVFSECSENPGIASINRDVSPVKINLPKYWSIADGATVSAKVTDCFSGVVKYLNPVQKITTPTVNTCKYALMEL